LHRADEIIVAEVCEGPDDVGPAQARLSDVTRYLAAHRVTAVAARVRPVEGTAAGSLLRLVRDETVDLIVAGAYGHSRLGEWVFGGMSECPVCCLFSH
jgi:nucleotide-binding universal stress UspA family protein